MSRCNEAKEVFMRLLATLLLLFILVVLPVLTASADPERLDINTAPAEQLKALPGIGDAYSEGKRNDTP